MRSHVLAGAKEERSVFAEKAVIARGNKEIIS